MAYSKPVLMPFDVMPMTGNNLITTNLLNSQILIIQPSSSCKISNYSTCVGCGLFQIDNISLEKCNHKLCKDCLESKLRDSVGSWVDFDRKVFKISPCPLCKELFRDAGQMLY